MTAKTTEHGTYGYSYDSLYQLINATNPAGSNEVYTYDRLGNRLSSAVTSGTWGYNTNNELLGFDQHSFDYDDNGDLIRKTVGGLEINYIYDAEDRLVQVEDSQGRVIARYYYDPFGRRLWKEVDGVRTCYLYSDEGLIGEFDASGSQIRTYGYRPDSLWTTAPLFQKQAGHYYWYVNDHAGTPQKLITTNGAVVWSALYDSFGNVRMDIEQVRNNLRFGGQYFDSETGLYYNYHRYYDPFTGRYLRPDPLQDGLNPYAYGHNNPLMYIDPHGLCALKDTWEVRHDILATAGMVPAPLVLSRILRMRCFIWWKETSIRPCYPGLPWYRVWVRAHG